MPNHDEMRAAIETQLRAQFEQQLENAVEAQLDRERDAAIEDWEERRAEEIEETLIEQSRTSWNGSTKKRLEEEDVTRDERKLRAELEWIRSRYDSAQVSDAVFAVVKKLETELSWRQHAQQEGARHG